MESFALHTITPAMKNKWKSVNMLWKLTRKLTLSISTDNKYLLAAHDIER